MKLWIEDQLPSEILQNWVEKQVESRFKRLEKTVQGLTGRLRGGKQLLLH